MGKEDREKEALLNLLISVVYRSRPVRWRLRRSLEQEKAKLERSQHDMQQLMKDLGCETDESLAQTVGVDLNEMKTLVQDNSDCAQRLGTLAEQLRPAVFHLKEGLEDIKMRNDKTLRLLQRVKKEKENKKEKEKIGGNPFAKKI